MSKTALKGAAFEYFVRQILLSCGFKSVTSDEFLIYDWGPGQMVHGLGQPHNADVLVEPPIQTPFYNLSRLIVECKCYTEPLGIEFARNVLGLRTDINSFDIVTPDILNSRRKYYKKEGKIYDIERYNYQVALASLSGFKSTTEAFSITHKIPLISFTNNRFKSIRDYISTLDKLNLSKSDERELIAILHQTYILDAIKNIKTLSTDSVDWIGGYLGAVNSVSLNTCIGITNSGLLLFLHSCDQSLENFNQKFSISDNGFQVYGLPEKGAWFLFNKEHCYVFELPIEIAKIHLNSKAMSNIVVYKLIDEKPSIEVLELSKEFLSKHQNRSTD